MASSLVIDLDTWICAVCKPCLKILSICDHDTISAYTK